jgi:hypothetical protein
VSDTVAADEAATLKVSDTVAADEAAALKMSDTVAAADEAALRGGDGPYSGRAAYREDTALLASNSEAA